MEGRSFEEVCHRACRSTPFLELYALRNRETPLSIVDSRTRLRGYAFRKAILDQLKEAFHLLARNRGATFEKMVDSVTVLEAVQEQTDGNASTLEAGCSAHLAWLRRNPLA
jgi:hypothetical protein